MRLAYLLLLHQEPGQFARLLRALHAPGNLHLLHVDRKSPRAVHAAAARLAERHPGVRLLASRPVSWGGYSSVEVVLHGMRAALAEPGWEFLVNLSGQDFPLRTPEQIAAALRPLRGANLIHALDLRRERPAFLGRLRRYTVEAFGRSWIVPRLPRRPPPPGDPDLYVGSQWFLLSRAACEWFARWEDPLLHRLERLYRHSWCPDEAFFQTALLNGPLRGTVVNDNRRFVVWRDGAAHPKLLGDEDYEAMVGSGAFFARKFEPDAPVLARLERRLGVGAAGSGG